MFVVHGIGDQFGRDGAELHWPFGQALGGLPYFCILHFAGTDRTDDLRHDSSFEIIVKDMSARKTDPASPDARKLRMARIETGHVAGWVTGPCLSADVLIEAAITVGPDIKAGHFLIPQIDTQRVRVLLAKFIIGHRVDERASAEVFGVPTRSRQRSDDGRGKDFSGSGF